MVENAALELINEKLALQKAVITHQSLKSTIKREDAMHQRQQKRFHCGRTQKSQPRSRKTTSLTIKNQQRNGSCSVKITRNEVIIN